MSEWHALFALGLLSGILAEVAERNDGTTIRVVILHVASVGWLVAAGLSALAGVM